MSKPRVFKSSYSDAVHVYDLPAIIIVGRSQKHCGMIADHLGFEWKTPSLRKSALYFIHEHSRLQGITPLPDHIIIGKGAKPTTVLTSDFLMHGINLAKYKEEEI